MKVLAISGSPRLDRMIHTTLKEILKDCSDTCEIISLSGKKINGCISCLACAHDNKCKVNDDWVKIAEKMVDADIIIFGAPNYYGLPNALSHSFLERTYCFRHNAKFVLADKKAVIVTTKRERLATEPVTDIVRKFFVSNHMDIIANMNCGEYSTCYTCGCGHDCEVGNVVATHGILEEILPCHLPKEVSEQSKTQEEILRIRGILMENGVSFN